MVNFLTIVIVAFAIAATFFMNYPPPPQSPIVYQWQTTDASSFQHGDHTIFYRDSEGNGTGVAICLHGFPTSSFDWYKVWPEMKRQFSRVIAIDFLGMGFSDKPRFHSYSIMEQADIVEQLLAHKLAVRKVHILAHDYGDTVAQELLARESETEGYVFEIQSICLLNGGIFPDKHYPRWTQKMLRLPIIGTILSKFANYWIFKIGLCEVFGSNNHPIEPELFDFWGIMRYQDGYRVLGPLLSYIDERRTHEDRWVGALQKAKPPLYMIYGREDPVNPPPFADHYRDIIPKPKIEELANVGHYVQLEAPQQMMKLYASFLKTLVAN